MKALKLVLEALGVGTAIDNISARKEKQKAIYLAKVLGIDLGYSYGWYVKGPYCSKLADDYYELKSTTYEGAPPTLTPYAESIVTRFKEKIIDSDFKPQDLPLPDWLELLASWHYLTTSSGYNVVRAREVIQNKKLHVFPYIDAAINTLEVALPAGT